MDWQADPSSWNQSIASLPGAHILQTREWGEFKNRYGWQPFYRVWRDEDGHIQAAALILQRTLSLRGFHAGLRVLYVPRGPLLDWRDAPLQERVLEDLQVFAKKQGAIFIKIDPEVVLGVGIPDTTEAQPSLPGQAVSTALQNHGWRFSRDQVQFRNSVWLDLTPSLDDILAGMKQKTRYNLRLAQKKGVTVRAGTAADLALLYKMYAETSVRDGFVIRSEDYYLALWQAFIENQLAIPLIAEVGREPVGALLLFHFAGKAWYLFGMSRMIHREKMPNYLLQWEAIRFAKAAGCTRYDLWGAPDNFAEGDSLWGVYRFKEGLGGQVVRTLGAWDYPNRAWFYTLYTRVLPRLLAIMRRRGLAKTRQAVSL